MRHDGPEYAGSLLCVLSAAGFGAMSIFAKLAYRAGVGLIPLLTVRFAIGSALLWALSRARVDRRALAIGFALGFGGYALESGLYFAALTRLHASLASLLLYAYPSVVVAAAIATRREPPTRRRLAALACASAGVALVLLGGGAGRIDALGAALALTAAACYAGYILLADAVAPKADPLGTAASVTTGCAVAFALAGLVSGHLSLSISAGGWGWIAAMAIVSTAVAISAFLAGLERVGPGRAAILSTVEPPFTVALAVIVFGDALSAAQIAGGVLVLAAVLVLQVRSRGREPAALPTGPAPARRLPHNAA